MAQSGIGPTSPWAAIGARVVDCKPAPSESARILMVEVSAGGENSAFMAALPPAAGAAIRRADRRFRPRRSEEHTSELQSLMRISYAVFCLKNKKTTHTLKA